jgi:hypothetical protein
MRIYTSANSPGMYIGDTQKKGFHHMVWEILDNSIDEHMGGHCDRIEMRVHKDGSQHFCRCPSQSDKSFVSKQACAVNHSSIDTRDPYAACTTARCS